MFNKTENSESQIKRSEKKSTFFQKTNFITQNHWMNSFIWLLSGWLLLLLVSNALASQVVYVANDGSGDYNCDGVDDQIEINQALDFVAANDGYTTVHLKGPCVYWISDTVEISANTILEGDDDAVIKLVDQAGWNQKYKPLVAQKGYVTASYLGQPDTRTENITIRGFEIDGNRINQSEPSGKSYYTIIQLQNCVNVTISDMYLHSNLNDAVRFVSDTVGTVVNSSFHDNRIHAGGHDGFYIINSDQFEVRDNYITKNRTNSGIRTTRCNHFDIQGNVIGNDSLKVSSGGSAVHVESSTGVLTNDVNIHSNYLYGHFTDYGIRLDAPSSGTELDRHCDVHIHHNIIRAFEKGGVGIEGFHNTLIENNTIDGNGAGISFIGSSDGGISGFTTIVRNNNITGSKNGGYGLDNQAPATHAFLSEYNNIYGNEGGHYSNASSETDIHADPLYVNSKGMSTMPGWHHVVATYDSLTEVAELYIDGKKVGSERMAGFGSIAPNTKSLYLGSYRGNNYGINGKLDDVAVWNRVLNDTEISSLWNGGDGAAIDGSLSSNLEAYWEMNGDWTDSSGNGHDATYSCAGFSDEAKLGSHAGMFNGENFAMYPSNSLSSSTAITIAAWVNRADKNGYGTILNKGSQGSNRHIWLYYKGDNVYFEFGNGSERRSVSGGVNPLELDFHVRSEYGRFQDSEWVLDSVTSPCVDAGDPASNYVAEPLPNGGNVNIGAYGNTPEASKSSGAPVTVSRIYEDAEDGSVSGWDVYDSDPPIEATISNVYDAVRESRVIELSGSGMSNGYRLRGDDGEYWYETDLKVIQWSMRYSEDFSVLIPVSTKNGFRYLSYSISDADSLGDGISIHHALDASFSDGNWHTVVCDLERDLKEAQPENELESVLGFFIRGSGRVDDIVGLDAVPSGHDSDGDGLTDLEESMIYGTSPYRADSDSDGISDGDELVYWGTEWNGDPDGDAFLNLLDEDSDGDGYNDGFEVENNTDPSNAASRPDLLYENAEDGLTLGWSICDNDPLVEATITNVYDALRGSRIIELSGAGMSNKYCLGNNAGENWHETRSKTMQWSMCYAEDFSVLIPVSTKNGFRYLSYSASDADNLGDGIVIHHGLGNGFMDGNWHTVVRDLEQDLKEAQPDNELEEVWGFSIRGSGKVDDILLLGSE